MHTPSDAGWLGRNFLRLLVIHAVACTLYVLSWEQIWHSEHSTSTGTAGVILFAVLFLAIPVAVLGGAYLTLVALLTGLLPREGIPLLCASVAAGALLVLALVTEWTDGGYLLALWCLVAGLLTLGVWSEFDGGG